MKVIFTIDSLAQGGTEQSIAELIPHLSKAMHIIVVYFYDAHHLKPHYEALNCELIYLNIHEKYGFHDAIRKFNQLIRKERPDVVVSSLYRSLIISRFVCWWTNTPLVGTFVNERYSKERKSRFKGMSIIKYYLTWLLDWITAFIPQKFISNSYSISVLNGRTLGIGSKKVKIIYRGRDTRSYPEWSIPAVQDKFVWMAIGRLIPQKGYDSLIDSFQLLKAQHPNVQLRIIGDGPLREVLSDHIQSLKLENDIILEGNKPMGWNNLYDANAFVLPSVSEGFSGALIEACITGIPIVASDIPMNVEAISPGKDAFFFRTGDALDLFSSMDRLMRNYKAACNIGKLIRLRAIDNYDIQHIADKYTQTLEMVVYGKKA
jgi:glycosyltransferase involved in cell wall biosynthesis